MTDRPPGVAGAPQKLEIADSLRGERVFLTGATGFLGKVLVEKLLWSVPEIGGLVLLIRPQPGRSAAARLREEILGAPIMARLRALHAEAWEARVSDKVEVVAGDLGRDRLGLEAADWNRLASGIDRVVAAAASVKFDERLDRALELNVRGAERMLALARAAGDAPLLHVSTCFVSGRRRGWVAETLEPDSALGNGTADANTVVRALEETDRRLRSEGGDDSAASDGLAVARVAAGRALAERYGVHDVYTLTKALAERRLAATRGRVPLTVVRPAIVESAAREPIPGWIEAVRVADPLVVAYGRGRTRRIPGSADVPLELVPVDHVVNAIVAAMAEQRRGDREPRVYQLGSSRNPLTLGELMELAREGFAATPLRDGTGEPISPRRARFVEPGRLRRALTIRRDRALRAAERLRDRSLNRSRRAATKGRILDHFIRLVDIYRPYLTHGARYRDDATRGLWARLSARDREAFPFAIEALDWRSYLTRCHVPGLVRFALRAETGAPVPARRHRPVAALRAAEERAREASSLFELFAASAAAHPEAIALQTCRQGRWLRYTYGQALTATGDLAARLADRYGVGRGDRVVLWSTGRPEWVLATLALHRLGAVTVPLDPQWPAADVRRAVEHVGAKLVCAAPGLDPPHAHGHPTQVIAGIERVRAPGDLVADRAHRPVHGR